MSVILFQWKCCSSLDPPLIVEAKKIAAELGAKVSGMDEVKVNDILVRIHWVPGKDPKSLISGHSRFYIPSEISTRSGGEAVGRRIDLQFSGKGSEADIFNKDHSLGFAFFDQLSQPLYSINQWLSVTAYKLKVTLSDLNEATTEEKARAVKAKVVYGEDYNCHTYIYNVLLILKQKGNGKGRRSIHKLKKRTLKV